MDGAIRFDSVSKRFTLSHERPRSLQETLIRLATLRQRRGDEEEFWALRDVSFEVPRGKTVGLVGTNGSGKSTALKLIAGILPTTAGEIHVNGRISALLELGAGMHEDLTGRENIFLNGTMLGLSNVELEGLFDRIVAFAELERFIDMQVKHYSSGMYMRLGFSVAVHAEPDILLLDEVLAVGDQAFQNKCIDRIYQMKQSGVTIVLVSHSLDSVRDLCDELVWLRNGEFMGQGPTSQILQRYLHDIYAGATHGDGAFSSETVPEQQRWGSGELEVTGVRLRKGDGATTDIFLTGDEFAIEIDYHAHQPIDDPMFGLALHRVDGTHLNGPNNKLAEVDLGTIEGRGTVVYRIPDLPLMPGSYDVTISAYDGLGAHAYDVHWRAYPFHVNEGGTRERYGMLRIPANWEHHVPATPRAPAPRAEPAG